MTTETTKAGAEAAPMTAKSKARERIARLEARRAALTARLNRLTARDAHQARKLDTRRKVLVGAMVLEQAEKDPQLKARLDRDLSVWLVRDIDRLAFGLEPLHTKAESSATHSTVSTAEDTVREAAALLSTTDRKQRGP